jgi:hypothetical protein
LNFGGGISNAGTLTLTNAAVVSSTAFAGGAIFNNGALILTNATLSGNSAGTGGSGISNSGGTMTITNTTISGNTAGSGNGGGITNNGATTLTSSTISGNSAPAGGASGGGVHNFSGTVRARNTIVALNTSANGPDFNGQLTSQGFNIIGNNAGTTITPAQFSDQIGVTAADLNLGPLQDNGGSTQTHALLVGSKAIDKGHSSGSSTDQRGFPRPADLPNVTNANSGDGGDIGAFELPVPGLLANISTRLRVETGDNTLIGGFIITGTQPKKVIIRAIGPSLGLADQLANPTLELFSGQTLLKSNDNWVDSAEKQAIIDSTIPPTNDLEAALVATLPANGAGYTAVIRGVNNATGIAVVQFYDLDRTVDSKLANISTRGLVQTGDNVLIAGTIVLGQAAQKVIIRAIGPSLGISGNLADPTLQLVDANGSQLAFNDNWRVGGQEAAIIATTIPPSNDAEAAIVYELPANGANYTAIVRGAGGTTGIAVVEVYALN